MQDLSQRYPVWFCDVWGVLHDGHRVFDAAADCLMRHRRGDGIAILVTNSPRSAAGVARQLDEIGMPRQSYDSIATSGDVTRSLLLRHGGGRVYHLGPARDLSIFAGLEVDRVPIAEAHAVLCTGLFDELNETAADYAESLKAMLARNLAMICANPDRMVRKGSRLVPCAGALAEAYAELGGKVMMAGKPFAPIYELALAEARRLAHRGIERREVLALGDGPETDMRGAAGFGIDAVFIADGVSDASQGLAAAEREAQTAAPGIRIVRTLPCLAWSAAARP